MSKNSSLCALELSAFLSHSFNFKLLKKVLSFPDEQIADVLLNQEIFAGVGNIIKNEILFMARVPPEIKVSGITPLKVKKLIKLAQTFSVQFYEWRKQFVLRKNLVIYQKSVCPNCEGKVVPFPF